MAVGGCHENTPKGRAGVGRRGGSDHAADEQVGHAAEMAFRVVAQAEPPAQIAVQGHAVQHRLQRVVTVCHRRRQQVGSVGGERISGAELVQAVRLVVDDDEPRLITADAEHGVDRAGEPSGQFGDRQRRGQLVAVGAQRIVRRQRAGENGADLGGHDPRRIEREVEGQLGEAIGRRKIAESAAVEQVAERRVDRRQQARPRPRPGRRRDRCAAPPR